MPGTALADGSGTAGVDPRSGTEELNGTTDIVIIFENFTARNEASFGSGVNVTGGKDIQFIPVLFATTTPSTIPAIQSNPRVASVGHDRQIPIRTPSIGTTNGSTISTTGAAGQTIPWGVQRIGASDVADWIRRNATQNVTVAVLDTGIDHTHPDLNGSVVWGANFTYGSERYGLETADDNNGHGTAIAGIIAARDNDQGIVGVAPGVQLYSIKVLRATNVGTISSLIRGIDAAVKGPDGVVGTSDDADIVQMSLGTTVDDNQLDQIVAAASDHAILVSAAGNLGDGDPKTAEVTYPAKYEETIAVAATDVENETTYYSSEGLGVDVAAPGNMILTLASDDGTVYFSGTSAAVPSVSGTVALLLAADQKISGGVRTAEEIRALLTNTAQDIEIQGIDRFSGSGLIRVDRAVSAVAAGSGNQTVSRTTVTGGDNVTLTVNAYASRDQLTISDSFSPAFADVEFERVSVNGTPKSIVFRFETENRIVITVDELEIGDEITFTYTVRVPENITADETYRIRGEVYNGMTEYELDAVKLTVEPDSTAEIMEVYDADNDQEIDISELGMAASDYASGELSISELGAVAQVYARPDSTKY